VVLSDIPLVESLTITCAPGTSAPVASRTVPVMEPLFCAKADPARQTNTSNVVLIEDIFTLSPNILAMIQG
jgi:hypothetical protein